jgi:hypothetical protein
MTEEVWNCGRRHSCKLNLRQDEWPNYLKSLGNERFLFSRQLLGNIHASGMKISDGDDDHSYWTVNLLSIMALNG